MKVNTAEELGRAIKGNEETIEIEGDLAKKTIRIKATGKVAWGVAIGAIGVAVVAIIAMPATGGASGAGGAAALVPAAAAFGSGGFAIATTAVAIAVGGGSVGVLNKLRKYKLEKKGNNKIVLHKK